VKLRRNIILIAAGLLLIGSFLLPNAVAGVTDSRRLNNITMIDSQSVIFETTPVLGLHERIELAANPDAELLAWKTGNVMNEETAESKAVLEFTRFLRGGPFEFDFLRYSVEEVSAIFIIDSENPTVSMIVWELSIIDTSENSAILTIDDETGLIMKIIYKQGYRNQNGNGGSDEPVVNRTDEELNAAALRLCEMMTDYYRHTIELADYQYSGSIAYYRADLSFGEQVLPMFGVVRATSFTINERV